ncbi:MAG: hypothetical protein ACI9Q9_001248, partial [Flavobacterium sp.]
KKIIKASFLLKNDYEYNLIISSKICISCFSGVIFCNR